MSENDTAGPFQQWPDAEPSAPDEQNPATRLQSRRVFLRRAVIASAATAGAVGAASAMYAAGLIPTPSSVRPLITGRLDAGVAQLSPLDPSTMCLEDTGLPGSSSSCFGGGTNTSGEFWLFFTIRSVAPGNYSADVTQSLDGGTATDLSTSSTPFELKSSGVHVSVGGSPKDCPTAVAGSPVATSEPIAVSVSTSTQDVQIALHIVWSGGTGSHTVVFNATLKDSGNNLVAAPASVSVVTPCP